MQEKMVIMQKICEEKQGIGLKDLDIKSIIHRLALIANSSRNSANEKAKSIWEAIELEFGSKFFDEMILSKYGLDKETARSITFRFNKILAEFEKSTRDTIES